MYRSIVVNKYKDDDQITIEDSSLDELREELNDKNFLVKLHAAPINPLDLLKLNGHIFSYKPPFTPGSEGSGVIVEAKNKELIGKKLSFISPIGSWREYSVVSEENAILLGDDVDLDSAACGFINPLTSQGLVLQAINHNAKGIVNLAAQSTIGKMINDLAFVSGLNCLNVIRGDQKRVDELKEQYKNQNVITLDQDPIEFQKQVKELSEKLQATVCLDPLGGPVSGQIFNNLPTNSKLVNYGSLSGKDIEGINPVQLRWKHKSIVGFDIFSWYVGLKPEEKKKSKNIVRQHANTIFKIQIEQTYSFDQVKAALTLFRSLKGGRKIILKPFI
ncbi:zinc-binding dehydrogenase family oxidoreductase (macronuclear) [Tetrahymena thermophila SB210]|uniref:Zinc-binding dehydrogenase family oxidoreductase n=1 Tax=Tetrahymena thermophila (strain SB210) TaxID=312017 RepID=I7MIP1_TETTS|nr:zinc-binding dehydrogenase family oxidoreductase [Tetrahymena thermophila SB210]EAS04617.1 zinc-binding dehydrogenase family oxidoreductase [Tetrahymena thermophila SB210]|eukprot:XP_001024862.1 zinc-binding dehydrogenase family oxidoreductase [Tetrahymena thermophila SB210]